MNSGSVGKSWRRNYPADGRRIQAEFDRQREQREAAEYARAMGVVAVQFHVRPRRSFATSVYDVIRSSGMPGDWVIVRTFSVRDEAEAYAKALNAVASL